MVTESCVGVLSFNKKNLTKNCINSVLNAGITPDSVFLLHNGSNHATQDELKRSYPSINHKSINKNVGYSGGFNTLITWIFSLGWNSVLFLTNDTTITKGTLKKFSDSKERTGSGIIVPAIYYTNYPDKIDSFGGFFDREKFTLSHYHKKDLPALLDPTKDYVPGTAFWITKNVFFKTGGMDESYHTYWEDADFSFRCHKSDIKIARCFETKIFHGIGQTCHKKPLYTTFYFQRNRILFCRKYLNGNELNRAVKIIERELEDLKQKALKKKNRNKLQLIEELIKIL